MHATGGMQSGSKGVPGTRVTDRQRTGCDLRQTISLSKVGRIKASKKCPCPNLWDLCVCVLCYMAREELRIQMNYQLTLRRESSLGHPGGPYVIMREVFFF